MSIGKLSIDLAGRRGWNRGVALDLTGREFALLDALLSRRGRLVSREQLTQTLCSWEQDITNNGLDIAIHRLRRKLESSDVMIRTIRGLGYVVEEAVNGERSAAADGSGSGASSFGEEGAAAAGPGAAFSGRPRKIAPPRAAPTRNSLRRRLLLIGLVPVAGTVVRGSFVVYDSASSCADRIQ
ncbi:winged helix-turn-helix domain-containing protein, partial [Lysobacter sp. 2RAB21]